MTHEKIAVLDFGGQYAHLIANRVRRLGVYSEILDNETPASELQKYKGLILSGGPDSVNATGAPKCDPAVFQLDIPILAICYGHQLMQHVMGGKVEKGQTREYGLAQLSVKESGGILTDFPPLSRVWMSHFDVVQELADGFEVIGQTEDCPIAAVADFERNYFGIQFHAEVTHTQEGTRLLENFLNLCNVRRDWNIKQFIKEEIEQIKFKIGDKKVFLLVSGGVDSTVCFALLEKALGPQRVYGLLVDTGLMRFDEANRVKQALRKAGFNNLHVAHKKDLFLSRLAGICNPEVKRNIIGELFWEVKESVAEELKLNPDEWIMAQGTIYPDTIETGGTKHSDKIKTHHNRVDLVQEMIKAGRVIEPIAQLYKDEVRGLGQELGLADELVFRQPFPGPGLGVRILCADSKETELKAELKQDFYSWEQNIIKLIEKKFQISLTAKVLPCKSVGVQGDERTYAHPVAIFTDLRDWEKLEKISTAITNHFPQINRVVLALHGSAEEFVLKAADTSADRVELLQKIDESVFQVMHHLKENYDIWQFPVVLVPVSVQPNKESIVLRPIVSKEAMTASFARIDWPVLDKLTNIVSQESNVSHLFYDLTHKPPGTIEWE